MFLLNTVFSPITFLSEQSGQYWFLCEKIYLPRHHPSPPLLLPSSFQQNGCHFISIRPFDIIVVLLKRYGCALLNYALMLWYCDCENDWNERFILFDELIRCGHIDLMGACRFASIHPFDFVVAPLKRYWCALLIYTLILWCCDCENGRNT